MLKHEQLEKEWAEWNGLDPVNMVACSSGTAALHLACEAGHVRGKRVVIPDYTMVACARAAVLAGGRVDLADCMNERLTIDPDVAQARKKMTIAVGAIMAVHIYGRQCNMDDLAQVSDAGYSTWLIEDLAEAHGVKIHPRTDAACWSFYANKIVGGEEGGAVYFRDKESADHARCLRSLGFEYDGQGGHDYTHIPFGHNYRMSTSHASLVLTSLRNYGLNVALRREQLKSFREATPDEMNRPWPEAPWVHDIDLPSNADRERVYAQFKNAGLPVRFGFKPMSKQREFRYMTPVTTELSWKRVLYVGLDPTVPAAETMRRAAVIRAVLESLDG